MTRCAAALLVLTLALLALGPGRATAQRAPVGEVLGPVTVSSVLDGDTFVVLASAGPRTVRLIGVDAPEKGQADGPDVAFSAQAAAFLMALFESDTPVWLELDRGHEDRYGRLLAYAYVEDPRGDWLVAGRPAVQANLQLAEAGLVNVMTIEPNTAYAELYERAVATARRFGVGLWSSPGSSTIGLTGGSASEAPSGAAVRLHCALYDPSTANDAGGEWVSVMLARAVDTTGYYLYDTGSTSVFALPRGLQPAGELRAHNPGQGVWNNRGDVIYLMYGVETVDFWDYSGQLAPEGRVICRE